MPWICKLIPKASASEDLAIICHIITLKKLGSAHEKWKQKLACATISHASVNTSQHKNLLFAEYISKKI